MELPPNDLKRAFREGRTRIGLWSQLTSPIAMEILAGSGFDFLVIDTEHAPNELPLVQAQLRPSGGRPHPSCAAWNDASSNRLDVGAQTLLVPFVQNGRKPGAPWRDPLPLGSAVSLSPRVPTAASRSTGGRTNLASWSS
jgi:4-hydroxy-2-oxoheptanedioate aldolase